jgi:hypothetical protein
MEILPQGLPEPEGRYGFDGATVDQVVASLEDVAGKLLETVGQIGEATAVAAGAWQSGSYVDFRAKLDDYKENAMALSSCVHAVKEWSIMSKGCFGTVDSNNADSWHVF